MIDVRGLTVDFGDGPVLDSIDLHIEEGETVAIMGSSGGGKSTLLKCISGLLIPQKGEIEISGRPLLPNLAEIRAEMGMVFQSSALFDYMTVQQNISFALTRQRRHLKKPEVSKLVNEALDMVGLEPSDGDKSPAELSGGMRKRVGIARAIVLNPKILLYDEPTTGLDPLTTVLIDSLIRRIGDRRGTTAVFVSHDAASCCRTASRICFLSEGRFIFDGKPAEFLASRNQEVRQMLDASLIPELKA